MFHRFYRLYLYNFSGGLNHAFFTNMDVLLIICSNIEVFLTFQGDPEAPSFLHKYAPVNGKRWANFKNGFYPQKMQQDLHLWFFIRNNNNVYGRGNKKQKVRCLYVFCRYKANFANT